MKYYKEISESGITYFYGQQPDYDLALLVATTATGLITAIRFTNLPQGTSCKPIERKEFVNAFNQAQETFTDFLKFQS